MISQFCAGTQSIFNVRILLSLTSHPQRGNPIANEKSNLKKKYEPQRTNHGMISLARDSASQNNVGAMVGTMLGSCNGYHEWFIAAEHLRPNV
jgi:hypothetical protein